MENVMLESIYKNKFEYEEEKQLGEGFSGIVVKCKHKLDCQEYAIKKVEFGSGGEECRVTYEDAIKEVLIISQLQHPNILKYHTAWIEKENVGMCKKDNKLDAEIVEGCLYIQLELCSGTLDSLIHSCKEEGGIARDRVHRISKQILEGLSYLHNKDIAHGDLTNRNIFHDEAENIKIGDFGAASKDPCPLYPNPNFINDIHKFAWILFELLLLHHHPVDFSAEYRVEVFNFFKKTKTLPESFSKGERELLLQILKEDASLDEVIRRVHRLAETEF